MFLKKVLGVLFILGIASLSAMQNEDGEKKKNELPPCFTLLFDFSKDLDGYTNCGKNQAQNLVGSIVSVLVIGPGAIVVGTSLGELCCIKYGKKEMAIQSPLLASPAIKALGGWVRFSEKKEVCFSVCQQDGCFFENFSPFRSDCDGHKLINKDACLFPHICAAAISFDTVLCAFEGLFDNRGIITIYDRIKKQSKEIKKFLHIPEDEFSYLARWVKKSCCLAFNTKGTVLAEGRAGGVKFYNVETGKVCFTKPNGIVIKCPDEFVFIPLGLAFNQDDTKLIVAGGFRKVLTSGDYYYDCALHIVDMQNMCVYQVCRFSTKEFSEDYSPIVVAWTKKDQAVMCFDKNKGALVDLSPWCAAVWFPLNKKFFENVCHNKQSFVDVKVIFNGR